MSIVYTRELVNEMLTMHSAEWLRDIREYLMHIANCYLATVGVESKLMGEGRDKSHTSSSRVSLLAIDQGS